MAKGGLSGKYSGGKGSEGYDLDVEIIPTIKNGKKVWELRRVDNNKLIREWKNAQSPSEMWRKQERNIPKDGSF